MTISSQLRLFVVLGDDGWYEKSGSAALFFVSGCGDPQRWGESGSLSGSGDPQRSVFPGLGLGCLCVGLLQLSANTFSLLLPVGCPHALQTVSPGAIGAPQLSQNVVWLIILSSF